jgi:hypothetical protein
LRASAEGPLRRSIVDTDPDRYRLSSGLRMRLIRKRAMGTDRRHLEEAVDIAAGQDQRDLRRQGGIHCLKINRHAGTSIELKPWQKRHPLLAAINISAAAPRSGAIWAGAEGGSDGCDVF